MAKKIKKKCILCGKEYEIWCPTCREALDQPTWLNIFHDDNCYKIYTITSKYSTGVITKEEAKTLLDECDLSYKNNLTKATIKSIDEIYKEVLTGLHNDNVKQLNTEEKLNNNEEIVTQKRVTKTKQRKKGKTVN